jgi:BRCT domain type II-containing protein
LKCCSREVAGKIVEALGGKFSNSVTSKTTYLVVGEDPGKTKLQKAQKLGTVKVINEEEFLKLIEPYVNVEKLKRGEHITEFKPEELIKGWKGSSGGEGEKEKTEEEKKKKPKTLFDLVKGGEEKGDKKGSKG